MQEPYLIDNLKFDIRLYVLITSCEPLKIFLYHEGLVRFATEEYVAGNKELDNLYMHLTNYAINKENTRKFFFSKTDMFADVGHKRSLNTILSRLNDDGHNTR